LNRRNHSTESFGPEKRSRVNKALIYNVGISAESVGAQGIHMQIVTIPPGARAKAHKHENHETAIYALRGESLVCMAKNWNIIPSLSPAIFLHSCRRAAPALQSERYRESGGLNLTYGRERTGERFPFARTGRAALLASKQAAQRALLMTSRA
jgi:hypothetical protein